MSTSVSCISSTTYHTGPSALRVRDDDGPSGPVAQ